MKHGLPDNETPFWAQLPDNETSFRSQLPETTGDFHPPNLLFKVINNNTGRLLFNVKSA
jgi:hypothetical protein